ncbi:MAG TPA: hypothetical protein VN253_13850, partial [Kofleriaceae bacterium]|nr:hypothetical protein [Kofleriaceae bacterium]
MAPRTTRRRPAGAIAGVTALALAGCPRPTPPPKPDPVITAPPAVDAAPVEPDLCHASVGWREGTFEIVGLPCVSRDGREVVFAKSDEQPRSLTVVAVTRADQLSRYAVVMEP